MKMSIKRGLAAFVLAALLINAVYTLLYRFTEPNPATRWLPLYDWIYNPTKE